MSACMDPSPDFGRGNSPLGAEPNKLRPRLLHIAAELSVQAAELSCAYRQTGRGLMTSRLPLPGCEHSPPPPDSSTPGPLHRQLIVG